MFDFHLFLFYYLLPNFLFCFTILYQTFWLQVASVSHSGSLQLQAEPGGSSGEEEHELRLVHREEEGGGADCQ